MDNTTGPSRVILASVTALLIAVFVARCGCQNPPPELFLNDPYNLTGNASGFCIGRMEHLPCPDPMLHFFLYSGDSGESEEINVTEPGWLDNSSYNPHLSTVMLVHGYRGGDSLMPMVVLKNEYIRRGEYNVITVDWGEYVRPPCYIQGVGSLRGVAKCTAHMLAMLEESGVVTENFTCVGHSLGAHLCGIISNLAPKTLGRIIGLDPARPLFAFSRREDRLDEKDARVVQVIHTNTGFYGLSNMQGSVDFCINKGAQPYCERTRNSQLCSHAHAICFMAESLDPTRARKAVPCDRSCPQPNRNTTLEGEAILMGQFMEDSAAAGMYCVEADEPPFCKRNETDTYGDNRCCPVYPTRSNRDRVRPTTTDTSFIEDF